MKAKVEVIDRGDCVDINIYRKVDKLSYEETESRELVPYNAPTADGYFHTDSDGEWFVTQFTMSKLAVKMLRDGLVKLEFPEDMA